MAGRRSRNKGKRGELEVARLWTSEGFPASTGRQHRGGPDSPDVIVEGLDVHVEVKRVEKFNAYDAIEQAVRDAGGKLPLVFHRRNDREHLVVLRAADFFELARDGLDKRRT